MKLYMFRTVPLSIIRSLFTVHSAKLCHTGLKTAFEHDHPGPARKLPTNLMTYTIAECTVNKLLMMDRGTLRKMLSFMPK